MYIPASSNTTLDIVYVDVNILLVLIVTPAVPVLVHTILDERSSGLSSTAVTVHVNTALLPLITVVVVTSTVGAGTVIHTNYI